MAKSHKRVHVFLNDLKDSELMKPDVCVSQHVIFPQNLALSPAVNCPQVQKKFQLPSEKSQYVTESLLTRH